MRKKISTALLVGGWITAYRLGRGWGSTEGERRRSMPGDDVLHRPQTECNHGTTIPVPPEELWPWLVQVGWHRGGWYTPRWVDVLFFIDNWPSSDRILPDFQGLAPGDFIPDGPPGSGCGFTVRELNPGSTLVLESKTHLPLSWRLRARRVHWTWSFVLTPEDDGRATRLVFRWRARTSPWWLTAGVHLFIVPADFVMSRGMFRGLAKRARDQAPTPEKSQVRASVPA